MARKDVTEAEEIKKRWQEHREELYKEDLMIEMVLHMFNKSQTSWNVKSSGL